MVNILNPGDLPSIDLSNIKGVLIDIDDTLYSYKTSHKLAIEACFKEFNSLFPNLFIFDEFNNLYRKARNEVTSRLQNTGSCRSRLLAFQMIFEEIDRAKDASKELASVELELDAQVLAKNLPTDKLISVCRVLMGTSSNSMTIPELKRDILIYAKNNPEDLIDIVNDPLLDLQHEVHQFFENGWITFKNNKRDVYYSLPSNKKKMMSVPFEEDAYDAVASYMQSNDGLEAYKYLKKRLKKDK